MFKIYFPHKLNGKCGMNPWTNGSGPKKGQPILLATRQLAESIARAEGWAKFLVVKV